MSAVRILATIAGVVFVGKMLEQNRQLRLELDERTALNAALADEVLLYMWARRVGRRHGMAEGTGLRDEIDDVWQEDDKTSDELPS